MADGMSLIILKGEQGYDVTQLVEVERAERLVLPDAGGHAD